MFIFNAGTTEKNLVGSKISMTVVGRLGSGGQSSAKDPLLGMVEPSQNSGHGIRMVRPRTPDGSQGPSKISVGEKAGGTPQEVCHHRR